MSILTAAFIWVLYSSGMASILAVIIILLKILVKNKLGVRWHYCVWFLVLIRLLVPYAPQSTFSAFNLLNMLSKMSYYSIQNTSAELSDTYFLPDIQRNNIIIQDTAATNDSQPITSESKSHFSFSYIMAASFIWILGIIAAGFYTLTGTLQFLRKVRTQPYCLDKDILDIVSYCKNRVGLKGEITVLCTDLVKTPAVFGFIRPKLLLPVGIDARLEKHELKYIIYHELAHLKRNDIVINCAVAAAQIVHWFNPIVWYSFYRMRQDCELACDALAMSYIDPAECKKYGQTIIRLLESFSKNSRVYGMAGIIEDKSQMKKRIAMISNFKQGTYRWTVISIVILGVMGCILLTNARVIENKDNKKIMQEASSNENVKGALAKLRTSTETADGKDKSNNSIKDRLVVIDPGHGGKDMGAVYPAGNSDLNTIKVKEKDLNLEISLLLYEKLKKSGIRTELTRKEDIDLKLADRAELANRMGASLIISVHNNAAQDSAVQGTMTLFNPSVDYSSSYGITGERAAQLLQGEAVSRLGTVDAGLQKTSNLAILKDSKMPSIVAQVAYITNESDRKNLMTEAFREKAAQALHDGTIKILSEMGR